MRELLKYQDVKTMVLNNKALIALTNQKYKNKRE